MIIVYTVLTGGYEQLNEMGCFDKGDSEWIVRYICYCDDPSIKSQKWEIKLIPHTEDPQLLSRRIKMLAINDFIDARFACYKDNNVTIKAPIQKYISANLPGADISIFCHNKRKRVIQEFIACEAYRKDSAARIRLHFLKYLLHSNYVLSLQLFWGGFFAFEVNDRVLCFLNAWFMEFESGARRDQLSMTASLVNANLIVSVLKTGVTNSEWHKWPESLGRRHSVTQKSPTSRGVERAKGKLRMLTSGLWYYGRYIQYKWRLKG